MRRFLLGVSAASIAMIMTLASVATFSRSGALEPHARPSSEIPPAMPAVIIEETGSAIGVTVTETSTDRLLEEDVTPLAATVIGRIAPFQIDPAGTIMRNHKAIGFRHDWPAIYASARFIGDSLVLAFSDELNRYRVSFDGDEGPVVVVTRPEHRAFLVSGLGSGEHEVRIASISEAAGIGGLFGLYVPLEGGALPPPRPLARQIEFIGDSDSVGYGNLSSTRECVENSVFELTDTQMSFGPQIARHFVADYQLIASSGIGVVRNYGGADPDRTMPALYPLRLRGMAEPYLPTDWTPQVIVLALGSNDFQSPIAPGEPWTDGDLLRDAFVAKYVRFLRDLRARNESAFLLMVMWPQYGSDYIQAHESVLDELRSTGEHSIDLIALPRMERSGCDWHPTLEDHRKAADGIARYIEMHPEVWGPPRSSMGELSAMEKEFQADRIRHVRAATP